jgi:hypothetical protein
MHKWYGSIFTKISRVHPTYNYLYIYYIIDIITYLFNIPIIYMWYV